MADESVEAPAPDQRMKAGTVGATWAVLVGATVLGWVLSRGGATPAQAGVVIVLAAIKIYLVLAIFMGLWRGPSLWHLSAIAWTAVTFGLIWGLVA